MNIENAKTLVGQLERLPDEKFFMACVISHPEGPRRIGNADCDTVACIAGWCSLLNGGPQNDGAPDEDPIQFSQDFLGLSNEEASDLFFAHSWRGVKNGSRRSLTEVTRPAAIAELNRMIAEAEAAR